MATHTHGITTLQEQRDSRQWGALESGGQTLSSLFLCRLDDAQTYRTQLITSGHPEYSTLYPLPEDVEIEETLTGIARIRARFGGVRSATAAAPARVAVSRPINAAQWEFEIVTLQNYQPRIGNPMILRLDAIEGQTFDTQIASTVATIYTVRFSLAPVLESVQSRAIGGNLYECRYFLTLREVDSILLSNGQPVTVGIGTFHGFTSLPRPTLNASDTIDPATVLPSVPTTQIRLASLTLSDGLDKQAQRFGISVRRAYYRVVGQEGAYLSVNSSPVATLPKYYPQGPPRILIEANPDNTPEQDITIIIS